MRSTFTPVPKDFTWTGEDLPLLWNEGIRITDSPWDLMESMGRSAYARELKITENASQELKDLRQFMTEQNIVLKIIEIRDLKTGKFTEFGARFLDLTKSPKVLYLSKYAFDDVKNLNLSIYLTLSEKLNQVPMNIKFLPLEQRELAEKMSSTFKTKFVNENTWGGVSYVNKNLIGLKVDSGGETIIHEITHATTDRKLQKAITPALTGRSMQIQTIDRVPDPRIRIGIYATSYRADEVEARVREIAFLRFKKLPTTGVERVLRNFIEVQSQDLTKLLEFPRSEWIYADGILRHPSLSVEFKLTLPKNLTKNETTDYLESVVTQRLRILERYAAKLKAK